MAQWFGPKKFGYGVGPRSWQGWLASALTLAAVIGLKFVEFEQIGLPSWTRLALRVGVFVAFVAVVCLTYENDERAI